jgi:hypothetical protein
MRTIPGFLLAMAILAAASDAAAQFRRDRMGSPREDPASHSRERPNGNPAMAAEPLSALERELISLKADIHLRPDQLDAWNLFENGVRLAAQVEREERRRSIALSEKSDPPPTALAIIEGLAQDERRKAEALAEVRRQLHSLDDKLDAVQRAMLDRRVVQSQAEPLGR